MAARNSMDKRTFGCEALEDRQLMAADLFGLGPVEPARAGGMPDIAWPPAEDGMWVRLSAAEVSDGGQTLDVAWLASNADDQTSSELKWTGFQGQIPVRRLAALMAGHGGGMGQSGDNPIGNVHRAGGMPDIPWLPPEDGMWFRLPTGSTSDDSEVTWNLTQNELPAELTFQGLVDAIMGEGEVSSYASDSGKKSTDELDPLGTSEESGSGEIIIYRDRYGEIEGTSETHEFMPGPDGQGDARIGPWF